MESSIQRDIGPHDHEVTIYDSYEIYAVCNKCGMHDWSMPKEGDSGEQVLSYFKGKYPNAKVVNLFDDLQ